MAKQGTSRLSFNPPLGRMPVLQFIAPAELQVDAQYQRSAEGSESRTLIRRIAQHWDWGLCQPLVISRRRVDGADAYFVIDGQHRWEAAKLRGDIAQLPCVVVEYASAADEAASFVNLNQMRRPLNALDLFKAALASEDKDALAIDKAMQAAGLTLAPHTNFTAWKPGMVANIAGIRAWWGKHAGATAEAMKVLAAAFEGEVLQYAGTIFPGVVAVCHRQGEAGVLGDGAFSTFVARLSARGQSTLREDIALARAVDASLGYKTASAKVVLAVFEGRDPDRAVRADAAPRATQNGNPDDDREDWIWCEQCDKRVSPEKARSCTSRFCKAAMQVVA